MGARAGVRNERAGRYSPRRLAIRWDRAAVRLPSRAMALAWAIVGAALLWASLGDTPTRHDSDVLPGAVQAGMASALATGSALVIIGILWDPANARSRRAVEQIGWLALALGWGGYAAALVADVDDVGWTSAALAAAQSVTCLYVMRHIRAANHRDEQAQEVARV